MAKRHSIGGTDVPAQRERYPVGQNRSGYPLRAGNRPQALAFQTFELFVPESEPDSVELATMAGQLAVGQYATPHTRNAAATAATTVAGAINTEQILTEDFVECLYEAAELNARDAVGEQYFKPHERQAARAAVHSILVQQGYVQENSNG